VRLACAGSGTERPQAALSGRGRHFQFAVPGPSRRCDRSPRRGRNPRVVPLILALAVAASCREPSGSRARGQDIEVTWSLVEIRPAERAFRCRLTLSNRSQFALPDRDWTLYFNFGRRPNPGSLPSSVSLTPINGDLYAMTPGRGFSELESGESVQLEFDGRGWVSNVSGAPGGFYFVFAGRDGRPAPPEPVAAVVVEPFERPEQLRRSLQDSVEVPTTEFRYRENAESRLLPREALRGIVPSPYRMRPSAGTLPLTRSTAIHYAAGLEKEAAYLARSLEPLLNFELSTVPGSAAGPGRIVLTSAPLAVAGRTREAYRLTVGQAGGIRIVGSDPAGIFYGIQSLRALIPWEYYREGTDSIPIPIMEIEDAPSFPYRGMHLDVARNFQTPGTVLKYLELMSFYKLNRFHFHLTDDEGWRIAIDGLPELTDVGGRRGHTEHEEDRLRPSLGSGPDPNPARSSGSGHYSRADYIAILRYAAERHIEVIPEIDVPGHARAAIRAMDARRARLLKEGREQEALEYLLRDPEDRSEYRSVQNWNDNVMNVCQESTYTFLTRVIDELAAMHREAGAPLTAIHVGGDEVPAGAWRKSPACDRILSDPARGIADAAGLGKLFLRRLNGILRQRGLATAGWEEIALRHGGEGKEKSPDPEFAGAGFLPYVWNSVWGQGGEDNAYKLANAGYAVVLANASNLYFDLAYDRDPAETGFDWAGFLNTRQTWDFLPYHLYQSSTTDIMGNPLDPAKYSQNTPLSPEGRENILGMQGQLWGENLRSPEVLEYLLVPRLLALAERNWAGEPVWAGITDPERRAREAAGDWNRFANRLGQSELPRLDYLSGGWRYRIPPPGARLEEGLLKANVEFPGITIRFTTDGSDPGPGSTLWSGPVAAAGTVKLRAFDTRGRGSRVAIVRQP